ncbi:MAG: hypothetical protein DI629_06040 [Mesorhizobium amorphae]|nr:MAG: hypothetical protein DI629_06040 [Mesorhizobium amorphae]
MARHLKLRSFLGASLFSLVAATSAFAQEQPTVDVVHWLTAGAEQAAISVLAEEFERRGGTWVDSAVPGGPSDAQALVMSRVAGGNPPGVAFLSMGRSAVELGQEGVTRDVKALAEASGLAQTSDILTKLATDDAGAIFALPVAIETDNLAWYSKPAYDKAGLSYPKTWDEALAQAPKLKEAGVIPIAVGAQGWQLSILFNSILMGEAGADTFEAIVNERSAEAAASPQVVKAFATMRALSTFADPGASNRAWNDTLNLVADGRAAMQVMGSWAGAELTKMGKAHDVDWACALPPGNTKLVLEGAGFQFPTVSSEAETKGQELFIQVLLDPKVQADFAVAKGALPSRLDADTSKLAPCDQMTAKVLHEAGGVPALGIVLSSDSAGQIEDLLSRFWAEASLTPEEAARQFAELLAAAN